MSVVEKEKAMTTFERKLEFMRVRPLQAGSETEFNPSLERDKDLRRYFVGFEVVSGTSELGEKRYFPNAVTLQVKKHAPLLAHALLVNQSVVIGGEWMEVGIYEPVNKETVYLRYFEVYWAAEGEGMSSTFDEELYLASHAELPEALE